jgi:hypothetical protein
MTIRVEVEGVVPRRANLWEHTKHLLDGKPFALERMQKVLNILACFHVRHTNRSAPLLELAGRT